MGKVMKSLEKALAASDLLSNYVEFIENGLSKLSRSELSELYLLVVAKTPRNPEEAGAQAVIAFCLNQRICLNQRRRKCPRKK